MNEIENNEIEKMASIMCGHKRTCQDCLRECTRFGFAFDCECLAFAEKVYKKGYRKQSETVKEFAEKIKASPNRDYSHSYQLGLLGLTENDINNLAEQYGKEEK